MAASLEDVARLRRDIAELRALTVRHNDAIRSMLYKLEASSWIAHGIWRAMVQTSPAQRDAIARAFRGALATMERDGLGQRSQEFTFWLESMKGHTLELLGQPTTTRSAH